RVFFLRIPPHPSSTPFPYTTLFRSQPRSLPSATGARSKKIRRPCPARLKARTPLAKAAAGRSAIHGARNTSNRPWARIAPHSGRSEEHTSELQSRGHLVCRLLLEKK